MRSKKDLIDISNKLNPKGHEERFYRFAESYLSIMKNNNKKHSKDFFDIISYINKNVSNKTLKIAMGVIGKKENNANNTKEWCSKIIGSKSKLNTVELDVTELSYVMGYCARIAKYEGVVYKKQNPR
ncbi:MAG: hypothetical protein ACI4I6_00340 [Hominimerdicola sp.]